MPVTEAAVIAGLHEEGFDVTPGGGPLIEAEWRRALGRRFWDFIDHAGPLPAYDPADIVFPAAHLDVLVWGVLSRLAFRAREFSAASFALAMYGERHAAFVASHAVTYDEVVD